MSRWLLGDLKTNFSIFILSGLAIVVGASWALMYNADLLLGALTATLGRNRRLAPVLKLSIAYPLRSRFRTGVTLAMFTLVVFTLVTGAITTGSFVQRLQRHRHVRRRLRRPRHHRAGQPDRATCARRSPHARACAPADFRVVSSQSLLPVKARQVGTASSRAYLVHGADAAFLDNTTYGFAAHGARLRLRAPPSGTRSRPASGPGGRRLAGRARASRTTTSARLRSSASRLLPRGPDVHARSPSTCATRRPAGACG